MYKNGDENNKQLNEKIVSLFESDIPRKITFKSLISNNSENSMSLSNQLYNDNQKEKIRISKFNPYDNENDKKSEFRQSNINERLGTDIDNTNIIFFDFKSGEKSELKNEENNLFINKIKSYINISSDEDNNLNNKKSKITKINQNKAKNFISPKLKIKTKNEYTKLTKYSTNNNKEVNFTDLKNGINDIKIRTTNFSTNISYHTYGKKDNTDINGKKRNIPKKVSFLDAKKSNIKKNIDINDNTFIHNRNKKSINGHNNLTNNKFRLISAIKLSKALKALDENFIFSKKKSKINYFHSKKKKIIRKKNRSLTSAKIKYNPFNQKEKEKNKMQKKENSNETKALINKIINNEKIENKTNKEQNNEISQKEQMNNSKSNPKNNEKKTLFHSFLCCLNCTNIEDEDNNSDNKANANKINAENIDVKKIKK